MLYHLGSRMNSQKSRIKISGQMSKCDNKFSIKPSHPWHLSSKPPNPPRLRGPRQRLDPTAAERCGATTTTTSSPSEPELSSMHSFRQQHDTKRAVVIQVNHLAKPRICSPQNRMKSRKMITTIVNVKNGKMILKMIENDASDNFEMLNK